MILSFNAINSLRQHIKSKARIHGIITDGGQAANVVPAHSAGSFLVRAADETYLAELKQKVLNCFIGAATATGARLEYKWDELCYAPMLNNLTLGKLICPEYAQDRAQDQDGRPGQELRQYRFRQCQPAGAGNSCLGIHHSVAGEWSPIPHNLPKLPFLKKVCKL